VQNIEIYLTIKISCQAGHIRLLGWIPEALAGHVRPSSLCRINQAYPAPYPGYRDLIQTCPPPPPSPNMSNLLALSRVIQTYPTSQPGSRDGGRTYPAPYPDESGFQTPQRLDFLGGYKRPLRLSSTVSHSFYLANTLRHSLELPTSLLQGSFKSKLSRRDLSLTLE
jgi:hypothetical protein